MSNDLVVINSKDNVAVCLTQQGQIPQGHKIALKDIKAGDFVIKYGEVIGRASKDIKKGDWVHSHNLSSHLNEDFSYTYNKVDCPFDLKKGSFFGFKRTYGRAGIRNDIYIIPTVGCVNNVCKLIETKAQEYICGSIDGVFALTHQFGCSQLGDDNENIKNLLASVALNPNASFVLFVGLGCENNGIAGIQKVLEKYGRDNIKFMICQKEEDEVSKGLEIIKEFINIAKDFKREPVDLSELCIGLKCGGSDGFSGLTANPTVGKISDRIVSYGGSAILTEVPEMFGAEQILMNKCKDEKVFENYKNLIVNFKKSYTDLGFPVYENPSPGNKEGGITTLEEKSLGCIAKAGSSEIVDVLDYGEQVKKNGLSALNGPGNDLIAATALGASGCQLVLFTTGRGTPFSTFVPTLKIGTNNNVSEFKSNWIDFNAYSMDDEGLWNLVKETIEGNYKAKSEFNHEIAFYKKGVTL